MSEETKELTEKAMNFYVNSSKLLGIYDKIFDLPMKELVKKALDFYVNSAGTFVSYDEIIELQIQAKQAKEELKLD